METQNPWRARRIQAELEKLGIEVSLATQSRYLPKRESDREQRQRWMTFLHNHRAVISAMDLLVVPTIRFSLLFVSFVIGHGRRTVLHVNVTAHPTSAWVIQQLREAFADETAIRFLIHDNDSIFSDRVLDWIEQLGIEPKTTALRSPWQNGLAERWIGTVRRELLDHVVPIDEEHLRRLLLEYVEHYNRERVHTRLRDPPTGRPVEERPLSHAQVVGIPRLGGLHQRYACRQAA
jgi:transposase InsO family protein